MQHIEFGKFGEQLSKKILLADGYQFVSKNYRNNKGEVDLICVDTETKELVFFEIKSRSGKQYIAAEKSIHKKKQELLLKTANAYCLQFDVHMEIRMDVVILIKDRKVVWFKHIKSAFTSRILA